MSKETNAPSLEWCVKAHGGRRGMSQGQTCDMVIEKHEVPSTNDNSDFHC